MLVATIESIPRLYHSLYTESRLQKMQKKLLAFRGCSNITKHNDSNAQKYAHCNRALVQ